jgi:thioredoxin reductase (NADPH)
MPQISDSRIPPVDCLIVGGGPAGLVAATYLARYRRSVLVADEGESRAALIPESHNYPGYAGISGPDLLALLRRQAEQFGARLVKGRVEAIQPEAEQLFTARVQGIDVQARTILMATGIIDTEPDFPGVKQALKTGALRYCPICDGFEAMDQRIGVLAAGDVVSDLHQLSVAVGHAAIAATAIHNGLPRNPR